MPSEDLLTRKLGPIPVWGWGGIGLAGAWLYAKYKAGKTSTAATSSTSAATASGAEPATGLPYYVIENNIPAGGGTTATPSQPVTPVTPPPATTPPSTTPTPPTTPTKVTATPIVAAKAAAPAAAATHTYVVKPGDNLSKIAAANGIGLAQLLALNPVYTTNPKYKGGSLIWAGDKVVLPGS